MAAISGHGTIIEHSPGGGGFVEIGELGDFTLPGVMRNEFDATAHNRDIDTWVMGVLRREAITVPVFFNAATNPEHVALRQSIIDNRYDGFRITFPDGDVWVGSGFVRQLQQTAPVDGLYTGNVTIRLSGAMYANDQLLGA
jgi:hypothetical protein